MLFSHPLCFLGVFSVLFVRSGLFTCSALLSLHLWQCRAHDLCEYIKSSRAGQKEAASLWLRRDRRGLVALEKASHSLRAVLGEAFCFCRDLGSKFCLLKERKGPVLFVRRQPCCTRELFAPPGWYLFILEFRTPEASTHTPVKTLSGVWCQVLAFGLTRKSSSV